MKKLIFAFFIVMCLAQWLVPGKMIVDHEATLTEGKLYKFRTRPIDPTDPFRGAYIVLTFEDDFFDFDSTQQWIPGQEIYLTFYDSAGFAKIASVLAEPPLSGDYIDASVRYVGSYNEPYRVFVDFPFDRFYLEESKAAEAERIYWENSRNNNDQIVYALVSVSKGSAALKDVMINDRSIVEIVREANEKAANP